MPEDGPVCRHRGRHRRERCLEDLLTGGQVVDRSDPDTESGNSSYIPRLESALPDGSTRIRFYSMPFMCRTVYADPHGPSRLAGAIVVWKERLQNCPPRAHGGEYRYCVNAIIHDFPETSSENHWSTAHYSAVLTPYLSEA